MGRVGRWVFGISADEVSFGRRRFRGGDRAARDLLEEVGASFLAGYHAALEEDRLSSLFSRLILVEERFRGFAFEGAAMGLTLMDALRPWKVRRWQAFLAGSAAPHIYLAHVGVGWTMARLPRPLAPSLGSLDPLLCWLAIDGFGFHEGYFHWPDRVEAQTIPKGLTGYSRRAYDQGLGRSLWFVDGADVERIPRTIGAFAVERQADLWSGVGLACAYAGGAERAALAALRNSSGAFASHCAQGVAFGAKARTLAENLTASTEVACEIFCRMSAAAAAAVTDDAREGLPANRGSAADRDPAADRGPAADLPIFEVWRQHIRQRFETPGGGP